MRNDGKKVRLSQCMIVKNEEKNIERALSWGKEIMWEQIVVDTGSTDRTVEIAERMGAKIFHFQWINDFSAAKNYAIDQARGDWIAFLDADEYFLPEDVKKISYYVEQLMDSPYHGIISGWMQLNDQNKIFAGGTQLRLFRNLPKLRSEKRIHEYLAMKDGSQLNMADASGEIAIMHTGYQSEANREKVTSKRNHGLIELELEDHPGDHRMLGYLGDEYFGEMDLEKAIESYHEAIRNMPGKLADYDLRSSLTFAKLLSILTEHGMGDENAILEVYQSAVSHLPKESDFDYFLGRYYAGRQEFAKGAEHLERAIGLLNQFGSTEKALFLTGNLQAAYELLAICRYNNGELAQCVKWAVTLLGADRYLMSTLYLLLSALRDDERGRRNQSAGEGSGETQETLVILGKLYDLNSLKDRMFVLQAAEKADYRELLPPIRSLFSQEELECIDGQAENR